MLIPGSIETVALIVSQPNWQGRIRKMWPGNEQPSRTWKCCHPESRRGDRGRVKTVTSVTLLTEQSSLVENQISISWRERVNHSYIAARLAASRSGDFQSPLVKGGRFQIAP